MVNRETEETHLVSSACGDVDESPSASKQSIGRGRYRSGDRVGRVKCRHPEEECTKVPLAEGSAFGTAVS